MSFFRTLWKEFHSRAGSYVFFVLTATAFAFLDSATWAYSWIADLYPLGAKFVPVMLGVIAVCAAVLLAHSLLLALTDREKPLKGLRVLNVIHFIFIVLGTALFIYTFVLVFGLDTGFSADNFTRGFQALLPDLPVLSIAIALPLVLVFCETPKKAGKAIGTVTSCLSD